MKHIYGILRTFSLLILCAGILCWASSCFVQGHGDSGQRKGWSKNSNNPHHINSTNPGKAKK